MKLIRLMSFSPLLSWVRYLFNTQNEKGEGDEMGREHLISALCPFYDDALTDWVLAIDERDDESSPFGQNRIRL